LNDSIQRRLLITTTCVLALFLTITGLVLDRSFKASIVAGAQEQLRLVIYSLMGSVQESEGQLVLNQGLSEPRLSQPDSGLYATVTDESGTIWTSSSAATTGVVFPIPESQPGLFVFAAVDDQVARYYLSYTVIWEDVDTEHVVFTAATDQRPFRVSIAKFRRSLGIGLGAATMLFILAQLLALRWGLRPLRTMAEEVKALESGERERLSDAYPQELKGLAENLDRFVAHEQRSRSRYRNALDDLAHSLKTPLAVVRNSLLEVSPDKRLVAEQLERMETTVTHQLSRASARGPVMVGKVVVLADLVERLIRALQKAYAERNIELELLLSQTVQARGDERDFMEIIGNLLENAFKYTHSRVRVTVAYTSSQEEGKQQPKIVIEDDGAGIPVDRRDEVLHRGQRLDEIESGQGIGLAVVAELVSLYSGALEIEDSEMGGAKLTLLLP